MFKKIETGKKYIKFADHKKGDVLAEGTYLGPEENKFGGINHLVKTDQGVVSMSAGSLNYIMDNNVCEGDIVQVIYNGMKKLETGSFKGKSCHQFDVFVDNASTVASKEPKKESTNKTPSLDDLD